MALSYGVTDYVEGGIITAVIALNVLIGFYQEYQAEKKMDSLRALSSPTANVLRGGNIVTVPSAQVVPGDVVLIKTGDTVPADLRIFEAMNLECDEKILTGEGTSYSFILLARANVLPQRCLWPRMPRPIFPTTTSSRPVWVIA